MQKSADKKRKESISEMNKHSGSTNRHGRRADKAIERLKPESDRKFKVAQTIYKHKKQKRLNERNKILLKKIVRVSRKVNAQIHI